MSVLVDGWEDEPDPAAWPPEPARVPRPVNPQHAVVITWRVRPGQDPERVSREAYACHVTAALLEDRCPRCYGTLRTYPDRPGWAVCAGHGWWRRESTRDGGGYEWRLGYNPHTGETDW